MPKKGKGMISPQEHKEYFMQDTLTLIYICVLKNS